MSLTPMSHASKGFRKKRNLVRMGMSLHDSWAPEDYSAFQNDYIHKIILKTINCHNEYISVT